MDLRLERISALKEGFNMHPYVADLGAELVTLEMLNDTISHAVVKAVAQHKSTVHSDLPMDLIMQGGVSFSVANFAGVYAAMVHTEKHTPLYVVNQIRYLGPIKEGDEIVAHATAYRTTELFIYVTFSLLVDGKQKLSGNAYYRDDKKK